LFNIRDKAHMNDVDVIVVGAGLSGLACARELTAAGKRCEVLESSHAVGGRARTDNVDGFQLDRGFQVLLTAYPEAQRVLDYDRLQLGRFASGALVRYNGKFRRLSDPLREPMHAVSSIMSPVATLGDKLRMLKLKNDVCRMTLNKIYQRPEMKTIEVLRDRGFSKNVIEAFFRPFLGGVFLDRSLQTSSRMFEFVFKMFSSGAAALPAAGMGAIAQQLEGALPRDSVRLNVSVERIENSQVTLTGGETLRGRAVVLATDAGNANRLTQGNAIRLTQPGNLDPFEELNSQSVTCIYFAADRPPIKEPILVLNGEGSGPINNLCVPSQVAPSYAPPGKSLVSVSIIGDPQLDDVALEVSVRSQLIEWFGACTNDWRHLRTYRIRNALPNQFPPVLAQVEKPVKLDSGIFVCGDYRDTASIQGAMSSAKRAAEEVLKSMT
jgi:phytoene dehydrogenase-like protein